MPTASFTVDAPAMIKEIASSFTQPGHAGIIMALSQLHGHLAEIAIYAHRGDCKKIVRIMDSMGITHEYVGEELMDNFGK